MNKGGNAEERFHENTEGRERQGEIREIKRVVRTTLVLKAFFSTAPVSTCFQAHLMCAKW